MIKVISESYIGEVVGLLKGSPTNKNKFPILGQSSIPIVLKLCNTQEERDSVFDDLSLAMREHPKCTLFINFLEDNSSPR